MTTPRRHRDGYDPDAEDRERPDGDTLELIDQDRREWNALPREVQDARVQEVRDMLEGAGAPPDQPAELALAWLDPDRRLTIPELEVLVDASLERARMLRDRVRARRRRHALILAAIVAIAAAPFALSASVGGHSGGPSRADTELERTIDAACGVDAACAARMRLELVH